MHSNIEAGIGRFWKVEYSGFAVRGCLVRTAQDVIDGAPLCSGNRRSRYANRTRTMRQDTGELCELTFVGVVDARDRQDEQRQKEEKSTHIVNVARLSLPTCLNSIFKA